MLQGLIAIPFSLLSSTLLLSRQMRQSPVTEFPLPLEQNTLS
jgi:hypothetical protein